MENDLGLTDRDKELKKWNAPYVYREFPKMLYRGTTQTSGLVTVEQRIVGSEGEERLAEGAGWVVHAKDALERETAAQAAVGTAAAERAWDDRRMSDRATAEAAAVDGATAKHLGAIPERPRRVRPSRAKKPEG